MMNRDIVFFDLETTGLDISMDRIIELCLVKLKTDGTTEKYYSRVNPGEVEIGKEAYAKHGISNEDLISEPFFKDIAEDVMNFLKDCDLGGYNMVRFDLPFLTQELLRDPLLIYNKLEPRDLESAYTKYTGKVLENAHNAEADILATIEIFKAQKKEYNLSDDNAEIENIILEDKSDWVDLSGKYKYNSQKEIIFTFGKHKNKLVKDICAIDPNYLKWIIEGGKFTEETKLITKKMLNKYSLQNI
jgi:DNA polymerase-3 subunit epsilon